MKVTFIDYKNEEIKDISEKDALKKMKNLSSEEGNFQILKRDDGLCIQWVHLGKGIFRVEKPISNEEIYYFNIIKIGLESLISLFFMGHSLEKFEWRKL